MKNEIISHLELLYSVVFIVAGFLYSLSISAFKAGQEHAVILDKWIIKNR